MAYAPTFLPASTTLGSDLRSGNDLLRRGQTNVVFLTWQFQRAWWDTFAPGDLLLVAAEREGCIVALAPFYRDEWSICFVGNEVSEWLDFIGAPDDEVVYAILATARGWPCPLPA